MDVGVCIAAKIDEVGIVPFAENLGYSHAWVADSQMIWSDCYAYLALAAERTRTINIGTGVSVVGTRSAPVTAHSIATVNRLAPGRTFLGLGSGNTAQRIMGQRPIRFSEYEDYTRVVAGLLRGEQVEFAVKGESRPIEFLMPELGFIDIGHPIPIHVSGFYSRTYQLAGKYGDGLVCSIPPQRDFVTRALRHVAGGAEAVGRTLPDNFYLTSLTAATILEPGEDLTSDRVIREVGPFAISSVHYIYDKLKENGGEPPSHMRPFWQEYCALVEQTPARTQHLRVHAGHCTYLLPQERKFVTPELIRATCLAGSADEIIEQVRELAEAGLHQIMLLPSLESQYRSIQDFSTRVMAKL